MPHNLFLFSNCERLDTLVNKEPPSRRHHAKIRVDQLKYDVQQIQSSYNSIQMKHRDWELREQDRQELLQTRFTTNAAAGSSSAFGSETSILIDKALEHNDALNVSSLLLSHDDRKGSKERVHYENKGPNGKINFKRMNLIKEHYAKLTCKVSGKVN